MKIREVDKNKKQFISLLLLADEQENMIDRYIEKGTMYVLEDGNVKAECVVTDEDNGILEIKNIAVDPQNQGKGYGKALIDFLASKYADEYSVLQVGTGDSPLTIPFYEKCGFVRSHKIPNFFTDNYDHPIYEGGVQLIDLFELKMSCIRLPFCTLLLHTTTPILTGMDALHGYSTSGILFSRAILRHCSRRFPDTSLKTRTHITKPTNAWREML